MRRGLGQLARVDDNFCGESENGESIKGNDTKNRMARLDGRRVHWVLVWERGDQHSLIFCDASERDKVLEALSINWSAKQ